MITRQMTVEERNETLKQTIFELYRSNDSHLHDDRLTLVFTADVPDWKPGQTVTVEVKA